MSKKKPIKQEYEVVIPEKKFLRNKYICPDCKAEIFMTIDFGFYSEGHCECSGWRTETAKMPYGHYGYPPSLRIKLTEGLKRDDFLYKIDPDQKDNWNES